MKNVLECSQYFMMLIFVNDRIEIGLMFVRDPDLVEVGLKVRPTVVDVF